MAGEAVGAQRRGFERARGLDEGDGNDSIVDELLRLTARSAAQRAKGNPVPALIEVEAARLLLDQYTDIGHADLARALPEILRQWARAYELTDHASEAVVLLQESFELAERSDDAPSARSAAGHLAWIHAAAGRHAPAAKWVERAARHPKVVSDADTDGILGHALRLADELHTAAALELLTTIDLARIHPEGWAAVQFTIAHLSTRATAPAALDELLAEESSHPVGVSRSGANLTLLTHAKTRLHLLTGDAAGAIHVTRGLPDQPGLMVARSAALLAADENRAVLAIARQTRPLVEGHPRWRTKLAAVEGVALARIGAQDAARELAERVVEAVPRLGLYSSLTLLSAHDIEQFLGLADPTLAAPIRERVLAHLSHRVVLRLSLLTRREREVLRLVLTGDSADRIAARLFVSRNTVKSQLASINRKLGVTSREQLIALARAAPLDAG
ncbi:LuxR C-terminal-related transcriptional regulator [Microbacterium sp. NPDC087868]|uniref:helix-turn-helix transcriptional regulator n=1 Tax=Microbacterium sp. NPDC087868 TaxID=3364195 RepID=UPI00384D4E0E